MYDKIAGSQNNKLCLIVIIHVIFSWTQIGRFGFTDREIGSQIGRFFRGKKYINFSVKNCYLQHRRSL